MATSKSIYGIIFLSLIVVIYSCSSEVPVEEKKESIDLSGERIIRIEFSLPGDDIGSPENQAILNKIIIALRSNEAGEIQSSGFGMGNMGINIKIKGAETLEKIKMIISENYPDAEYIITKPLPSH